MSSSYSFLTRPLAVAAAALAFSGAAQADILHYNTTLPWTDTAAVSVGGVSKGTVTLTSFNMYDSIGATSTSSVQNQNTSYWKSFIGFCFDINQPINASAYGWNAGMGTTGITNGVEFTRYNNGTFAGYSTNINKLFDLYWSSAVTNTATRNADTIAGFQLAIWALEYGGAGATLSSTSNSITYGLFSATGIAPAGAATQANTYLSNVLNAGVTASTHYSLTAFMNNLYQDVITVALPEPDTDLLVALGLVSVVIARRRRKA